MQNLSTVTSSDYECLPVVLKNGGVYHVSKMTSNSRFNKWHRKFPAKLEVVRNHYWLYFGRFERFWPFRSSFTMRRLLFLAFRVTAIGYIIPLELTKLVGRILIEKPCTNLLPVEDGDVLLLLDSSWHGDFLIM